MADAADMICEDCSCACCGDDASSSTSTDSHSSALTVSFAPLRRHGRLATSLLPANRRSISIEAEERLATSVSAMKIDFHQHCVTGDESGLESLLRANRAMGVRKAVLLALRVPGSTAADVTRANDFVLSAAQRHSSELIPFVTIIEDDPNAASMLSECVARGARGLKLIGWSAAFIRAHDYDLCSPVMRSVFEVCEAHCLPVVAHIFTSFSEEEQASMRVGEEEQASREEEQASRDSKPAPPSPPPPAPTSPPPPPMQPPFKVSATRDYLAEIDQLLSSHPQLILILAHFALGFDASRLPRLHALLARHPNLHIDTSLYGGVSWRVRAATLGTRALALHSPRHLHFAAPLAFRRLCMSLPLHFAASVSASSSHA